MLRVGLTGGIGSGKSTIAKVFNIAYRIPIFEADKVAKHLMTTHQELIEQIKQALGKNSYTDDNQVNKQFLANLIFNNPIELEKLNNLVHNRVRQTFLEWTTAQNAPYVIEEAAILIESGASKLMDKIITVDAPQKLRIKRTTKRDNMTTEQILQRMSNQLSDIERKKYANFTIINDNKSAIVSQISAIHAKLIQNG